MVERFTPAIERGSSPDYDYAVMQSAEAGGWVLFSDYEAQISGHRISARNATSNLLRAKAAEAERDRLSAENERKDKALRIIAHCYDIEMASIHARAALQQEGESDE